MAYFIERHRRDKDTRPVVAFFACSVVLLGLYVLDARAESLETVQCVPQPDVDPPTDLMPGRAPAFAPATLCPEGEAPEPIAQFGPKGRPGVSGIRADSSAKYYYAGGYQYVSVAGLFAKFSQHMPRVWCNDFHSLVEMAAQSSDGLQGVEVGWTVDPNLNGDDYPHLFVFNWVNGQPGCYNGCGWVQVSANWSPGMQLPETSSHDPQPFAIRQYDDKWWVGYQGEWIGYFPNSIWNETFTEIGLAQWFGEVAAARYVTPTDMGSGHHADSGEAAVMDSLQLLNHDGSVVNASPTANVSRERYYSLAASSTTHAGFGGPGGF